MVQDTNLYSQFVGFLKIILPLAALALMSTVFLFARAPSQENAIPYAEIEALAQEPRLSGAQLSGMTDDGSVIELTARTTRPSGDTISAEALAAGIDTADGIRIDIRAGGGEIDNTTRIARLTGLAHLQTSNGFEMEAAGFSADLTTGRIRSDGALEVQAPFGSLTAGQLVIETPEGADGQVMLFQNGVRLLYTPQQ
jgi:lipopolysaccharide export system protein LptC